MPGKEEGEGLVLFGFVEETHGLAGLGVWLPIAVELALAFLIPVIGALFVEQGGAVVGEEVAIEAVAVGAGGDGPDAVAAVEMPLAEVAEAVAGIAEDFAEVFAVAGDDLQIVTECAGPERMLAGEEQASKGSADGGVGDPD